MTDPFAPLQRIERAARRGRGVRLDAGETALLWRLLELSDAATQAHLLAPRVERTEAACGGPHGPALCASALEGEGPGETVLVPRGAIR